jgi:hypothetical protein
MWLQDVRKEHRWNREFAALIRSMLAELRASPPPAHTLGAQLLNVKDPHTGAPCVLVLFAGTVGVPGCRTARV